MTPPLTQPVAQPRTAARPPAAEAPIIFFDGACGLCRTAIRWLLRLDRRGRFRCAPLHGATYAARIAATRRATLPDSLVLCGVDGTLWCEGQALREIGRGLGGVWRVLATAAGVLPAAWLDGAYRVVARHRRRHATGATPAGCAPFPPAWRDRLLP